MNNILLTELRLIEEFDKYEKSLDAEEAVLCSAISKMTTDDVICPVCKKLVYQKCPLMM